MTVMDRVSMLPTPSLASSMCQIILLNRLADLPSCTTCPPSIIRNPYWQVHVHLARIMRFHLLAIVTALVASMSVSACSGIESPCQTNEDCCLEFCYLGACEYPDA
ncbi:hypothetical protein K503DRAFT_518950 [Rhizopogon vinicolor AM-OR11-026]|uniref:Uncharacterized protein n=1 Tax=Rhizopogon vinicolor AM-OR11-026 TaxID=1314800 RepID=A0A1B7MLM9_9AGAM|nr:hypothetical protein K503DRAFT_518950 [Rhizopogon vinicolor AM-OR11-026]